jgi:zinc/manganese transport system permease protein
VLSLAITPAAAAQRLSARPAVVTSLSVLFALLACDGGLVASLQSNTIKASVFVTTFSFAIYVLARIAGGALRLGAPRSRPQPWRRRSAT